MSKSRSGHALVGVSCLVMLTVIAVSCGDPSTVTGNATTATTSPASVPDEGGFGAPAAAPGEFGQLGGTTIAGTADLAANGCWYLTANGESALLIAPVGTDLGDDGITLVTTDGLVIGTGTRLDSTAEFVGFEELPGGADGRWRTYAEFCDPTYRYVVVAQDLEPAFDPAAVDPVVLAGELDASVFDTDYGCGYGFTTGDPEGRWALYVNVTTATPPGAGPVTLPDDRFEVTVTAGAHLFTNHCDDVAEWFEPEYSAAAQWPVVAGEFGYPGASEETCGAPPETITLVGVVVDTPAGEVPLEPIEITNTSFGCFAG